MDLSRWPKVTQLEVELLMVASEKPISGHSRGAHIKNVIQMLYPSVMARWNDWNELSLWAWENYSEIGTTGCAAAGKTFTFTLLGCIEYLAKPMSTRLALSSTSIPNLRGRIWSEVMGFIKPVYPLFGLNIVDSQTKIQFAKGDDKHAIVGIAVDSGSIEQAVGKIQGFHPDRTITIIDEAAQTQPAIFEARFNLSVGAQLYKFVAIANASDQYDAHGKFCEPKGGWSTITADHESWETKTGICIHFDGLKSPNVKKGRVIFDGIFDQAAIDACRTNYGENSLQWWSYVRGFWPPSGVRNTILDAATIQEGKAQERVIWAGSGIKTIAALDPAFTTDGDDCCLAIGSVGKDIGGNLILNCDQVIKLQIEERVDYPAFYQVADKTIEFLNKHGVRPEDFCLDSTGAGAGIADIISQRWQNGFQRVSFGGSPTEDVASTEDNKTGKDLYFNRVTQLWGDARQLVVAGRVRGLSSSTAKQLCSRLYSLKKEKMCVESKREMKARTSGDSPDEADAFALLCNTYIRQNGLSAATGRGGSDDSDWEKMVVDHSLESDYSL